MKNIIKILSIIVILVFASGCIGSKTNDAPTGASTASQADTFSKEVSGINNIDSGLDTSSELEGITIDIDSSTFG